MVYEKPEEVSVPLIVWAGLRVLVSPQASILVQLVGEEVAAWVWIGEQEQVVPRGAHRVVREKRFVVWFEQVISERALVDS